MGLMVVVGDDDRGMESANCPGSQVLRSLDFFFCDRGSKRRKGTMGLSPEKQSWMRFVHVKNASLQIEYA
jgi:hypothetical protein